MIAPPRFRSNAPLLGAGLLAAAVGAICCAGPLLALFAALGAATVLGTTWALAIAVVAAGVAAALVRRRRRVGHGPSLALRSSGPVG